MWPFTRGPKNDLPTFTVDNTVGPATEVTGDLKGPGGFRIDGFVAGSVLAGGAVLVGESGVVEGAVHGRDVVILGIVRGDVECAGHGELNRGQRCGDGDDPGSTIGVGPRRGGACRVERHARGRRARGRLAALL